MRLITDWVVVVGALVVLAFAISFAAAGQRDKDNCEQAHGAYQAGACVSPETIVGE